MQTIIPKSPHTLRILHTADWHIGKQLAGEHRYAEFGEFLDWLIECIQQNQVDTLIVAGDIFDTMTPSHTAQELYYRFLGNLKNTTCQNVVIIAGNHDSPSLLDAPKMLFCHLNIFVIGTITNNIQDEIITLHNKNKEPVALLCAVPYLRERDVRSDHFGDTATKDRSMTDGIANHYATLAALCQDSPLPVIATGHLFAVGAIPAAEDDGTRKLYASETKIGTLGLVGAEIFDGFDYVALGHLHREQMVGNRSHIRYSGSPMAFCFDEINQDKKVLLIDFKGKIPTIAPLTIPIFRQLVQLKGDWETIKNELSNLVKHSKPHQGKAIWLAVECQKNAPSDLKNSILGLIQDCPIQLLIHKKYEHQPHNNHCFNAQSLHELTPNDVFAALLNNQKNHQKKNRPIFDDNDEKRISQLYQEVLFELENDDVMAI